MDNAVQGQLSDALISRDRLLSETENEQIVCRRLSSIVFQLISHAILFAAINIVGLFVFYPIELVQRKTFRETR
uniref:2TM domain-containing protein n=1 Tax=Angiostrongylus cantonensis TaxID=6313 RepID=A0A0K0DH31_ANGCA